MSWSTWSISLHTFPLVLTTLVAYFGLHLGSRIVVPKEPNAQLKDLDTTYNLSSFYRVMKKWQMLISIHLENMIKQTCILMTQVKIFLFLQSTQEEDLLGNQTENKKHRLEEGQLKKAKFSKKNELKNCTNYLGDKTYQRLEPCLGLFEISEDGGLYYEGKFLTKMNGELRMTGVIVDTLGIRELQEMGFNVSKTDLKARYVLDWMESKSNCLLHLM